MTFPPRTHPYILVGAVCLAYLNAFGGDFQFDDYNVIVNNPSVHSWAGWWDDLPRGIRPLLKASYALNWISGLGLFGFHLFNLAVHAINVVLVYALSRKFLEGQAELRSDPASAAALLTALLFALHPVQTEAVTYISGRSTSLMAMFYLGSLLAYVHGRPTNSRTWLYLVSPALFVLSLATKEVAVTLPASLLLWEATCRPAEPWRAGARRQVVHWTLLLVGLVLVVVHPRYWSLLEFSFSVRSVADNVLTQIHGVAYLLSRLLWAHRLNIDPDLSVIQHWTPGLVAEAVGLAGLLALGVASLRRRPWLAFGVLWLFLHLLPTNSIVPRLDVANERQLYLPVWGIFLSFSGMLVVARPMDWQAARWAWVGGAAVLVALLACLTVARNHVYRSEVALWEDTVVRSSQKARVYNNLGYAYFLAGRSTEAKMAYLTALRLDPQFVLARNNLAALASGPQR